MFEIFKKSFFYFQESLQGGTMAGTKATIIRKIYMVVFAEQQGVTPDEGACKILVIFNWTG